MAPEREVAIYSPASSSFLQGGGPELGGREVQMTLLAEALEAEGISSALIVWPTETGANARRSFDLVEREPQPAGSPSWRLTETRRIWRVMARAVARLYVFRGGSPQVLAGAIFCRLRRRKLVFSVASDLDFDSTRPDRARW